MATKPDDTGSKQALTQFKPGQSGNPAGRPLGARSKLGEEFLEALHADFAEHGKKVIEAVRSDKPKDYLKIIASILPKDLNINVNAADDMSDDQLIERIRALDATIQPYLAAAGARGSSGNAGAKDGTGASLTKPAQVH